MTYTMLAMLTLLPVMATSPPLPDVSEPFHLDEWDKLMIVSSVALFLMLVLVLTVCVLSPMCWCYPYCPCQTDGLGDKQVLHPGGDHEQYGAVELISMNGGHGQGYLRGQGYKGHGGRKSRGGMTSPLSPLRESEVSDWSDISSENFIEINQEPSSRKRKSSSSRHYSSTQHYLSDSSSGTGSMLNLSLSQPDSRLAYGVMHDAGTGKMHIRVIQLGNFRLMREEEEEEGEASSPTAHPQAQPQAPYVKVRVYRAPKSFFSFRSKGRELLHNNLDTEFQTKIVRRTDNPVYNESFEVKVDDVIGVTSYVIRFLVCDLDPMSRHVVIGEVTCDLSREEKLSSGEEILYNDLLLQPQDEDLGELHIGLMYLPTAEKLSVTVIDAKGLKPLESSKKYLETFIKVALIYEGKQLKKTKTTSKEGEANLVFNETFVFDVPAYQLDKVHFSMAVIAVEKGKERERQLLGRVYVGVNCQPESRAQWCEMVQSARTQVACWHRLRG